MRKFLAATFVLFALILITLAVRASRGKTSETAILPRNVVPRTGAGIDLADINSLIASSSPLSLLPLREGESVIETLNTDFDGDGYDDQINAVRRSGAAITLVVGIYDSRSNRYLIVDEIDTAISHEQSFTYSVMDMTGNHRNSLVYSGLAGNGDYVMQIFQVSGSAPYVALSVIGNFRTNGTIFIQQVDRYDAYDASRIAGASYPVWVYTQDTSSVDSLDTVQTLYDWNGAAGRYVIVSTSRVTESRHLTADLARIQAGGMESVGAYLDGLWTREDGGDGRDGRTVFFDYGEGEISFVYDDIQEVFTWSRNVLRRNGVYISAVNAAVDNIQRQVEVNLTGTGELSLRVQDDVRMNISENSLWDGSYRKVTGSSDNLRSTLGKNRAALDSIQAVLAEHHTWSSSDTFVLTFDPAGGVFSVNGAAKGRYALKAFSRGVLAEFRGGGILEGTYALSYENDLLTLQRVALSPGDYSLFADPPLAFSPAL